MDTTTPKPFCFVLMPFDSAFADVYQIGIKESCLATGAYCERVDEQVFDGGILDRIYNQIAKADMVIADMTGRNPNVFYEVGYAHALGKRTVLLTSVSDDIPFDLKHFPHIIYGSSLVELREQLTRRLQWFISNPEKSHAQLRDGFMFYLSGKPLEAKGGEYSYNPQQRAHVSLVLQNVSSAVLRTGSLKVAFLFTAENNVQFAAGQELELCMLPNGLKQVSLPDVPDLLPGQYHTIGLDFHAFHPLPESFSFIMRAYSEQGPRDFEILVRKKQPQSLK